MRAKRKKSGLWISIVRHRLYFVLMMPGLVYFMVFKYIPLAGMVVAFKDVAPFDGLPEIIAAPFVGFKHFNAFFYSMFFWNILRNTVLLSVYNLLVGFPAPIILAFLLNEVPNRAFKRAVQTFSYLPHFLSMVIVAGLVFNVLSPDAGIVNTVVKWFGGTPVFFLGEPKYFRAVIVGTALWQELGWSSIIYLAAIAGIDTQIYEAATVDGAGRLRQMWSVTLPGILSIVSILFVLQVGRILDAGFERVLLLYSPVVYEVGDIIDTYVYRAGILELRYSFASAVGMFKSIFALVLIVLTNSAVKRVGSEGLW